MKTSVQLPVSLNKGAKIAVKSDSKNPYTVLYDRRTKKVLGVLKPGAKTITLTRAGSDIGSLMLVGSPDAQTWKATKTILDKGGDPGPPGTAGDGNGKIG
jgi:hypothetical protein